MADDYPGDLVVTRRADGSCRLDLVHGGPLRVAAGIVDNPLPEVVVVDGDASTVTFRGTRDDGTPHELRYRIVGYGSTGPERFYLTEPVDEPGA
jgi:hypothetical protein